MRGCVKWAIVSIALQLPADGQEERMLTMKLKDRPMLVMSMVLIGVLAGLALAVATFPVRNQLPWSTVITAAAVGGVVIGLIAGIAWRLQRRRGRP